MVPSRFCCTWMPRARSWSSTAGASGAVTLMVPSSLVLICAPMSLRMSNTACPLGMLMLIGTSLGMAAKAFSMATCALAMPPYLSASCWSKGAAAAAFWAAPSVLSRMLASCCAAICPAGPMPWSRLISASNWPWLPVMVAAICSVVIPTSPSAVAMPFNVFSS